MKTQFLKSLTILSLISLICSCAPSDSIKRLFLVDISKSNLVKMDDILNKVNTIYFESNPNDQFRIVFFSSRKYLVYDGGRFSKDREFLPLLRKGRIEAEKIQVAEGTSFEILRSEVESSRDSQIYVFTDGFFEKSKLSQIKLNNSNIEFFGVSIENNEKLLELFEDNSKVKFNF